MGTAGVVEEEEEVKLIGYWASPFALRVTWALKLKGVPYQYIEEDPQNKTELLLRLNPVHKKVPVLVHNGKPVAESLIILEYIDETWKHTPLLPVDPYERAKARFWAKFVDDMCVPAIIEVFSKTGEEQERAIREARENLKILEGGFEGKRFFSGDAINFSDVAVGWVGYWARIVEEITGVKLVEVSLASRFEDFLELPTIRECVPPWEKLLQHYKGFHTMLNMPHPSPN